MMNNSTNLKSVEPTESSKELELELEGLFAVSKVLSRSLKLTATLSQVVEVLHDQLEMKRGLVTLLDPETGEQLVGAVHQGDMKRAQDVRYQPGEGIVGAILQDGETVVTKHIQDDPRFLDRLGVYEQDLPFIGVPIRVDEKNVVGVLAAQPMVETDYVLRKRARFMQMVANLIAQSVRLSWKVESEKLDLKAERDQLRRTVRGDYGFDNIVGHSGVMRKIFEQIRQVAKWNTTVLIRGELCSTSG
jgi:Nif-specific regulatory protein